jgi:hypothetical protein
VRERVLQEIRALRGGVTFDAAPAPRA